VLKTSKLVPKRSFNAVAFKGIYRLVSPNILKCSLYASFFIGVTACQPQQNSNAPNVTSPLHTSSQPVESLPPLLTLDELLNTDDFQMGIKQSVLNDDQASLRDWQQQLLAVAKEVRLSERDLARISGEQGLVFIEFEAKKQLFHDEFIEQFMNFESIDDLIQKYPYLSGLHQRALSLINARDIAIQQAAKLLSDDGLQGVDYTQEARAQWKAYMINSGKLEELKN
jgi:hypothetical protein